MESLHRPQSSLVRVWRRFRQSRLALTALFFLGGLLLAALLADVLANSRPLYCRYNGESHFPAFSSNQRDSIFNPGQNRYQVFVYATVDWRSLPLESVLWAPVPYGPDFLDLHNTRLRSPWGNQEYVDPSGEKKALPLRFRHWLGTTQNGQDVLAGLIHGARVSLLIGVVSMGIATLIGILLGGMAGYFGDYKVRIRRGTALLVVPGLFLAYFYGYYARRYALLEAGQQGTWPLLSQLLLSLLLVLMVLTAGYLISRLIRRLAFFRKQVFLPLDSMISRSIEVLRAVPLLLILIAFSILFKGSIWFVTLIIGFTGWTAIALLLRAEMIRVRQLYYVEAARSLGLPEWRLIFRHALPNVMAPIWVAIAFGIAAAIIAESGLSFLNLGVGEETLTWGKLLQKGRSNMAAWWLTLFPALAIFFTVLSFNLLGERLRDALDPQLAGVEKKT